MRKLRSVLAKLCHAKGFHVTHFAAHVGYFGLVFAEGHGLYAFAAGAMALFTIVTAFDGE